MNEIKMRFQPDATKFPRKTHSLPTYSNMTLSRLPLYSEIYCTYLLRIIKKCSNIDFDTYPELDLQILIEFW